MADRAPLPSNGNGGRLPQLSNPSASSLPVVTHVQLSRTYFWIDHAWLHSCHNGNHAWLYRSHSGKAHYPSALGRFPRVEMLASAQTRLWHSATYNLETHEISQLQSSYRKACHCTSQVRLAMVQQLRQAHERTLFHLVPLNHKALAVLGQRQNGRFVSNCGTESQPIPGLEVGYHVSKKRSADVIATVGRAGDLTIDDEQVSRIHFDFQVRPAVCALFLCMRRAGPSGIYVKGSSFDGTRDKSDEEKPQWVDDGIHLGYSKKHIIDILGHQFQIGWCETISDSMKAKVDQEYKRAQQEALNPNVAVQYEDTVIPESAWEQQHMTRNIITRRRAPVEEDVSCRIESGVAHLARFINPWTKITGDW